MDYAHVTWVLIQIRKYYLKTRCINQNEHGRALKIKVVKVLDDLLKLAHKKD